jgi:hypothetical protein
MVKIIRLVFLILSFLFLINFALSLNESEFTQQDLVNFNEIKEQIKDEIKIDEDPLEIVLSENSFTQFIKIIFNIEEEVTLSKIILLISLFICFFIILFSLMDIFPFFENLFVKFFSSFILTILIFGITGAINEFINFAFDLSFLKENMFTIMIIVFILLIISSLARRLSKKLKKEKMSLLGQRTNEVIKRMISRDKIQSID